MGKTKIHTGDVPRMHSFCRHLIHPGSWCWQGKSLVLISAALPWVTPCIFLFSGSRTSFREVEPASGRTALLFGPNLGSHSSVITILATSLMITGWLIKAVNQVPKKFECCLEFLLPLSSIQCRRPGSLGMLRPSSWVRGPGLLWVVPPAAAEDSVSSDDTTSRSLL